MIAGNSAQNLFLASGPFNIRLRSGHRDFIELLGKLYPQLQPTASLPTTPVYHYQINIDPPPNLRRFIRPQVELLIDQIRPFEPYPKHHAMPLFEWGLNWIIAMTAHQNLMLHSAVLEYKNTGYIFPAMPGSGKSTLCAALSYSGWRLLSDEFGLLSHSTGELLPMPRAIGLKNESIEVIKEYLPQAFVGPSFYKTRKGTVAHVAAPAESIQKQNIPAKPGFIIFPRYSESQACKLVKIPASTAFTRLSNNSFNYKISRRQGFTTLSHLIQNCQCYSLEYHSFEQAIDALSQLSSS